MNEKEQEFIEIILKRQKRKRIAISLIITTVLSFITCMYIADNDNLAVLLVILTLTIIVTFIWLIILAISHVVDYIKNGLTSTIKKTFGKEAQKYLKRALKATKFNLNFKQQMKVDKNTWITFLILFIVWLFVHNIGLIIENSNKNAPTKSTESRKEQQNQTKEDLTWFAQYACEKEIKARAIYPPSVKVHFRRDNYIKGNSYTMYGTVDSQNAFGAMVRQNFACEAIIDKENDKYWVNDLNIE